MGGFGQSGLIGLLKQAFFPRGAKAVPQAKGHCTLTALPMGHWEIQLPDGQLIRASLQHVWPSFAWLTLKFSTLQGALPDSSVRLTVWKHRLSATAWQELRVMTARQVAMPDRVVHKGSP